MKQYFVHDEGRPDDAAAKVSSVQGLHRRPPEEEHALRPQQMLAALTYLLEHTTGDYTGKRELLQSWFERELLEGTGGNLSAVGEQLVMSKSDGVQVTVLPVLSDLQTDAKQILYCGPLDKRTRDLFDVSEKGGVELERGEPITPRQWMVHRLRSIFKKGPSDDVVLIMSMLLKLELSWLNQVQGLDDRRMGALMKHKGTIEYSRKTLDNIKAAERSYGPATFSFSMTMNAESDHFLAAYVAQNGELEQFQGLQVWDAKDEKELLTVRPGRTIGDLECGYFVHQKTGVRYDSCKFHTHCKRSPLQDWAGW